MVEDAVEDDPHAAGVGLVEQLSERGVAAEQRIDHLVVVGVIAVVRGRREDRVEVERGDPQLGEFVEVLRDAQQVAALEAKRRRRGIPRLHRPGFGDAPARREAVREDLVEDGVATQSGPDERWLPLRRLSSRSPRGRSPSGGRDLRSGRARTRRLPPRPAAFPTGQSSPE
jgi:hypothetical protein